MQDNSLIIIGAGIAGLSAGCYARLNGYPTTVFEQHIHPGGVCTSWERKGYTFDYCIHNLGGTADGTEMRRIWEDLGALENARIFLPDPFVRIEGPEGKVFEVKRNLGELERHMKEIAPEDGKAIDRFTGLIRSLLGIEFSTLGWAGWKEKLRILPKMRLIQKYTKISLDEMAKDFSNPFLKRAFPHILYNMAGMEVPVLPILIFLAEFQRGDLGWVEGGSLAFSQRIAERFTSLGGKMETRTPVEKILVQDGRAVGVRLKDGSEHKADRVISAADGYTTIYGLLDGNYTNAQIDEYYKVIPEREPFGLIVYMGVDRDLSHEPHSLILLFEETLSVEGREIDSLYLTIYPAETGMAPAGKSVVKVEMEGTYEFWKTLYDKERKVYQVEKEEVYQAVVRCLEGRFPGIGQEVEAYDVSTPVTAERFSGNLRGWQPWPPQKNASRIQRKGLSRTLPGLKNFHMVGHWATTQIGISSVAVEGRELIRRLCREDDKSFTTSLID